jgi:putative Mg2+ transporter-C (MgtC) family protein
MDLSQISEPFRIFSFWFLLKYIGIKIAIATLCGSIIGYERELKNKAAGMRTIIIICVGSMIPTSMSFLLTNIYKDLDPTRMIGQIITGVGFLGAGVIMKHEDKIIGVTTASFIWLTCSIGILIGAGINPLIPIILTIGLVILSVILEKTEKWIKKQSNKKA